MSYTMCPACGQHALKVANRCPRCGLPFEQQFFSRAQPPRPRNRIPVVLVLGAVLVLMLGTAEWINRRKALSTGKTAPATTRDSGATVPPAPLVTRAVTPLVPDSTALSQPVEPLSQAAPVPSPSLPPAPAREPETPAPAAEGVQSFTATDWVNVRARPSSAAPAVGVLKPGEGVRVDSTIQGWYRVQAGRVPAGYVDRRLLESRAP